MVKLLPLLLALLAAALGGWSILAARQTQAVADAALSAYRAPAQSTADQLETQARIDTARQAGQSAELPPATVDPGLTPALPTTLPRTDAEPSATGETPIRPLTPPPAVQDHPASSRSSAVLGYTLPSSGPADPVAAASPPPSSPPR